MRKAILFTTAAMALVAAPLAAQECSVVPLRGSQMVSVQRSQITTKENGSGPVTRLGYAHALPERHEGIKHSIGFSGGWGTFDANDESAAVELRVDYQVSREFAGIENLGVCFGAGLVNTIYETSTGNLFDTQRFSVPLSASLGYRIDMGDFVVAPFATGVYEIARGGYSWLGRNDLSKYVETSYELKTGASFEMSRFVFDLAARLPEFKRASEPDLEMRFGVRF